MKSSSPFLPAGLDALLMIGLENVEKYDELQEIEFGRGFGYREPLHIGNPLLPGILWRQLVSFCMEEGVERKGCPSLFVITFNG